MTKRINYICPKCGGRKFITPAMVTQDWLVDAHGSFIRQVSSYNDVVVSPNSDNAWSCSFCGEEGVSLEKFGETHDLTDMVFEISRKKISILREKKFLICSIWQRGLLLSQGKKEDVCVLGILYMMKTKSFW